ncbi:MAG: hypothetical protein PHW31_04235 [Candidatus Pacebacteria bacterium]|nr:hypothetical protein [Candidatus Paceibacterota bacterium]
MGQETKKENKPMFWIGIAIVAITLILLLTAKEELGTSFIPLGIIGIVFIAASRYRIMK